MSHDQERTRTRTRSPAAHDDAAALEPGRSSRSAVLLRPARAVASGLVQCKAASGLGAARLDGDASVHDAAERGVSGAGGALPHHAAIQRSFGAHDVGGVRAFVGGGAASAAHALGAHAYATGNAAAFASAPDLHTAAHEAAHVIQQRSGLQLDGGVGRAGDAHERHADAVADLVVQGRSAEALLDRYGRGGGRGGGRGVQLLSEDDEALLDAYIEEKNNEHDLNLKATECLQKRIELSAKYEKGKKNGLKDAKRDVDTWIKGLLEKRAQRLAELLEKQREKNQTKEKDEQKAKQEHKAKESDEPDDSTSSISTPSSSTGSKKKTFSPLDLSQVNMAPLTGFASIAKQSASLPQPVSTATPVSNAKPIISKVKSWKPSQGHDGCSATTLTTAELQEIVDWAASESTKYFVKKGAGTGSYSAKNQLKIIHKVVVASGGKNATYHITADTSALGALQIEEEDA
jgi:hypothetical protein